MYVVITKSNIKPPTEQQTTIIIPVVPKPPPLDLDVLEVLVTDLAKNRVANKIRILNKDVLIIEIYEI